MGFSRGRVWLLGLTLSLTACSSVPPTTLQGIQNQQKRQMIMECYKRHEGFAEVYGAWKLVEACRQQVREKTSPIFR